MIMDLPKLIKEVEKLGIKILFAPPEVYSEKGRHLYDDGEYYIIVNDGLDDIEKIQVILHEKAHYLQRDTDTVLCSVPTYLYRIENHSEKERISDFLSLVNAEYPIDETFNYIEYMKNAYISPKYETFVRETARDLYQVNLQNKVI
ncbi:ImmA/IrrE family metallo-endopeptidase [Pseudolactococcus yaeyamensis]